MGCLPFSGEICTKIIFYCAKNMSLNDNYKLTNKKIWD